MAAKASEIEAHLPAIFAAVASLPSVRLIVKPHPAETAQVYLRHVTSAHSVTVEAPEADLGRLLAAADAIITMNSTVAIDGLVLGLPALVVGIPNNLSPFVDAGVMDGVAGGDAIRPALERLLYNRPHRDRLLSRAAGFADTHSMRADGRSAARAAEEILALTC
jgi:capsular polysaccharide export protein